MHKLGIAAPLFGNNIFGRQLVFDAIGVGAFFIHFVDCHNQRNTSGTSMQNSFFGLRHNTIVSSDNQNNDIGTFRAARSHSRERCVPGRVQEGNHAVTGFYVIGTDMLGNTARFTTGHFGLADIIEQ